MAKQDNYARYTIRVPAEVYERIAAAAEREGRSVNAEIAARLESSLSDSQLHMSDLGVMALLKRFDAGVTLLEDVLFPHVHRSIDLFIEKEAAESGRQMTRPEATREIVFRFLKEQGYLDGTSLKQPLAPPSSSAKPKVTSKSKRQIKL